LDENLGSRQSLDENFGSRQFGQLLKPWTTVQSTFSGDVNCSSISDLPRSRLLTLAKGHEDFGAIFFDFTTETVGKNGKNTTPSVDSRLVPTVAP
jgi:hypothetical protein